ncbi:MAG TPA: hypothetical protein VKZ56_06015 [Membranihabitans sp.]|nr:hypothetical protein [Membranihabitans sp.]
MPWKAKQRHKNITNSTKAILNNTSESDVATKFYLINLVKFAELQRLNF